MNTFQAGPEWILLGVLFGGLVGAFSVFWGVILAEGVRARRDAKSSNPTLTAPDTVLPPVEGEQVYGCGCVVCMDTGRAGLHPGHNPSEP